MSIETCELALGGISCKWIRGSLVIELRLFYLLAWEGRIVSALGAGRGALGSGFVGLTQKFS